MNIDILRENMNQAIDSTIEQLKQDALYIKHQQLLEQSILNHDIDTLLTAQMTLHNMELEAVYQTGHCDCLQYLWHINAIKNE